MKSILTPFLLVGAFIGLSFFYGCSESNSSAETVVKLAPMQRRAESELRRLRGIAGDSETNGVLFGFDQTGGLLVKFAHSEEVFTYDQTNDVIHSSTERAWAEATGKVVCRERENIGSDRLFIDEKSATLRLRNSSQAIPTLGRFVLRVMDSPTKDLSLVLSADGPRTRVNPGLWGFGGGSGGETYGRRYVQLFSATTNAIVGEPVGLVNVSDAPIFSFCWTDNEKYIIAYEVESTETAWVEIDFHIIQSP